MTALRHQVKEDGRVLVTVLGERPQSFHIDGAEMKRFSWSVLADLDPEGAESAGYVAPAIYYNGAHPEADRAPWGQQLADIVNFLGSVSEASTAEISRAVGTNRQQVAVQCCKLRRRGHLECVRRGQCGSPAIWRLGPVSLEAWRTRHLPRLAP